MYSQSSKNRVMVFAELINEYKEWSGDKELHPYSERIRDESDYHKHIVPFNNRVFKYEFSFAFFLNGTRCYQTQATFQENDQIQVKYEMKRLGLVNQTEYL